MSKRLYDHLISVNYGKINNKIKKVKSKNKKAKKEESPFELYEDYISRNEI